jgi:hypothetical protein
MKLFEIIIDPSTSQFVKNTKIMDPKNNSLLPTVKELLEEYIKNENSKIKEEKELVKPGTEFYVKTPFKQVFDFKNETIKKEQKLRIVINIYNNIIKILKPI